VSSCAGLVRSSVLEHGGGGAVVADRPTKPAALTEGPAALSDGVADWGLSAALALRF